MAKKLVSLIVPAYNEESNIENLYSTVKRIFSKLKDKYDLELVFINDGSRDNTQTELDKLASKDSNVKIIEFSRNFGKEIALTAGINSCTGDACILYDCDLQYPAELLPEFLKRWELGNEVVVGLRKAGKKEKSIIKKLGSYLYFKLSNKVLGIHSVKGAIDYRLMDRIVIDEFNKLSERNRMTRALIDWLGFKRDYIEYEEKERQGGKSSQSLRKLVKLSFDGVISQSLIPLKVAGYLGLFITFISTIMGIFMFVEKYILKDPWDMRFSGPAMLAVINMFLVGIILICLGLITLYIANIHNEVNNRPMYIIRKKKNF